jgi:hypothetical protein
MSTEVLVLGFDRSAALPARREIALREADGRL